MKNSKYLLLFIAATLISGSCFAQNQVRKKTITRVFWQDAVSKKLKYADLSTTDKWHMTTGSVSGLTEETIESLGPMVQSGKQIALTAMSSKSNLITRINSGVTEQPHGNHFHWTYAGTPAVDLSIPGSQGKRIKQVGDYAYISNDNGGFSRIAFKSNNANPVSWSSNAGGPNASVAVSQNAMGYAIHNGVNGAGKVDIVNLNDPSGNTMGSFNIPSGNLVAAEANSGKVFFASPENIAWIAADGNTSPTVIPVSEATGLSIAGPMISEKNWVMFTSNAGSQCALCMINALAAKPVVQRFPIEVADGLKLSAPKTKLSLGKRFAFVFQQKIDSSADTQELLTIIELDPNRDQNFNDAVVRANIPVGSSKVDGERGFHNVCFDDYGRFAIFTNPADGTLAIMTLNDMQVRARFQVGGTPDRIVAVGSPEHFH